MTDSIEWGPEIAVNGVRPGWLKDEELCKPRWGLDQWYYCASRVDCVSGWERVTVIKLPADHPYYSGRIPFKANLTNWNTADLIAELRTRTDLPDGVVLPEPEPDWEAWGNASEVAHSVYFSADEPTSVRSMTRALIASRPYMPTE